MHNKFSILTQMQHLGTAPCDADHPLAPVAMPSIRTSTVRFHSLDVLEQAYKRKAAGERLAAYGRMGMDTHAELEKIYCLLEGGERTFLASSGVGAISMVLLSLLSQGQHVLYTDNVYEPVRHLHKTVLARMGIEGTFAAGNDLSAMEKAIQPNTKILYAESPGSLLLEMLDLPALADFAKHHNLIFIVDNTWGSGWIYHPLHLGADITVNAGTKYLGGHSDLMLGAAVIKGSDLINRVDLNQYALGYSISADDAWLAIRGVRTLPVRMTQHAKNALAICEFFDGLEITQRIMHPAFAKDPGHALWQRDCSGSNGLLSVELKFTAAQARCFVDSLELFGIGYSWGGFESLVQWVDTSALGAHAYWSRDTTAQVLRLHIGLERVDDLITDLQQALAKAKQLVSSK